jgi:hypothetical protein
VEYRDLKKDERSHGHALLCLDLVDKNPVRDMDVLLILIQVVLAMDALSKAMDPRSDGRR